MKIIEKKMHEKTVDIMKRPVPPRGQKYIDKNIFTERFVIMRGTDNYLRLFYDGSCEFVCFDKVLKKWVFLCFPPNSLQHQGKKHKAKSNNQISVVAQKS